MVAHNATCQTVKSLLEVYEDVVKLPLMLEVLLAEDVEIEDLFNQQPARSSAMMFSVCGLSLFSMIFSITLLACVIKISFDRVGDYLSWGGQ